MELRINYKLMRCLLIPILLLLLVAFYSCDSEELCLSNQESLQGSFYSVEQTSEKDTTPSNVTIYGVGRMDSLLQDSASVGSFFLPLSHSSDTTQFVFKIGSSTDTIEVVHSKELAYISEDCGFMFNFDIKSLRSTYTVIDTVIIDYNKIRYGESLENIKIFIY
ncbi:DUF6452 family protein [bacterium]|nr:DUF6452 family protein [bacterium]